MGAVEAGKPVLAGLARSRNERREKMNHRKLLQQVIGVMLVMLFLVGCGSATPAPVAETPTATPTPIPPAATPTPEPPTPTFTPAATTGQVKGRLVDEKTQQPIVEKQVFLPLAEETNGQVSISFAADTPETRSDSSGVFLFEDIPPGKYGLGAYLGGFTPSTLVKEQGGLIVFEVTAGQVIDLGTIPVK